MNTEITEEDIPEYYPEGRLEAVKKTFNRPHLDTELSPDARQTDEDSAG